MSNNTIKKLLDYNRVCPVCGEHFVAKVHNAIYCSSKCKNWAQKCRSNNIEDITRKKICKKCGKSFIPKVNGWTRNYCFDCVPDLLEKRSGAQMRQLIKQWSLEYKGNKCAICGYDRCSEALDFHHIDEDSKNFTISDRNLPTGEWPLIQKELDKCILVCANCHREIHANFIDLKEFLNK